jgi:Nucleotidyltransferase domain
MPRDAGRSRPEFRVRPTYARTVTDADGLLALGERLVRACGDVFASRLVSVVAYGSSVTGDVLPGYSDFDCLIALTAPVPLADLLALQARLGPAEVTPFSYLQPTFVVVGQAPRPVLVPGSFAVLGGLEPSPAWVCGPADLVASGERWLAGLPAVTATDAADWSLATPAHYGRRARLHLTRIKPTVRALLTRSGAEPVPTWAASWDRLAGDLTSVHAEAGGLLGAVLGAARGRSDRDVALSALEFLNHVCAAQLSVTTADVLMFG